MRFAELVPTPRLAWLAGAIVIAVVTSFALRPSAANSPPQVDIEPPVDITVAVHDNVGDPTSCASDITTSGTRVYVHLKEDARTCTGVTRVYRIEGDHLIFERELAD